LDKQKFSVDN